MENDIIIGATKYAELLESEREKSEKLREALEEIMTGTPPFNEREKESWINTARTIAGKALTEYKTTSK